MTKSARQSSERDTDTANHTETWLKGPPRLTRRRGDLSVALCYPAPYPLGMSNLGFQTVLGLLLEEPGVVVERAFWGAGSGEPGVTHDGRSPLSTFDVVAFSVSYEEDYIGLAATIGAAGIPLWSEQRGEGDPLVIAGGVCAHLNTEPVAPFLDAVLVGDADALVGPFIAEVRDSRGLPRSERLARLALLPGSYVPALYEPTRDADGRLKGFDRRDEAPLPVRPAVGGTRIPASVVLSDGAVFRNMFLVEVSRGCARGCRFCAAGHALRPRRHRNSSEVLEVVRTAVRHTNRVGLVTAALLDHPQVLDILAGLAEMRVELGVSSLRADLVTQESAALLAACGVRTATMAPETGTEALRGIIGKPMSDDAVIRAACVLADAGIETIKIYFMIGLPGERPSDVEAIPELVRRVRSSAAGGGARVSVSVSPFVPKARTAFQWFPMADERELRGKIRFLRKTLSARPRVEFSSAGPREARREGALSLGGRELAAALAAVSLANVPWKAALRRSEVDVADLVGTVRDDGIFPWDVVAVGPPRAELRAAFDSTASAIAARGE